MNLHIPSSGEVLKTAAASVVSDLGRTHDTEEVDGNELLLLHEHSLRENGRDHEKTTEITTTTRGWSGSVASAVVVVVRWYYNILTIRACYNVTHSYDEHVSGLMSGSRRISARGDGL